MVIKAVICTLDNLPILTEQVRILQADPLIDEIIVVNNGSIDGTKKWLESRSGLTVINRENKGAGPGRNAGLDAAGQFDYVLMLDGGIRPLIGGTQHMLDYLERHPDVDVIAPEVMTCFTTDIERAHRRMVNPIDDTTFPQRMLSSTAYCLCRASAWDGIRFSEEGPFGEPGWGVDDNYHAFEWNEAGIVLHNFGGVQVYRRASGSFGRLQQETGIWPTQYGSVYEKRVVMTWQKFPHQWNKWLQFPLQVSAVIVGWNEYPTFTKAIDIIHKDLDDISHEIIFVNNGSTDKTKWWLDTFALRQYWGDIAIDAETGEKIMRKPDELWTGNVIRIDFEENVGAGAAFNAGFDRAKGKYIFYLAGDIIPTIGSVRALYNYLEETEDTQYACVNAWTCQEEDEQPEWDGDLGPRQGLGNYAYSYAMIRREVIESGCYMADSGPFSGPGCGYEEVEMAYQMYSKGYRGFVFNKPKYYHQRRDFQRSGFDLDEEKADQVKQRKLTERRKWLATRWSDIDFGIIHYHIPNQPPEKHINRVGVIYKAIGEERPGPGGFLVRALRDICKVEQYNPGEEPEGLDAYVYVDDGDYDYFHCPEFAHPSHFWAIDMMTPQQPWRPKLEGYAERAPSFDYIYAAQPSAVEYFKENGIDAQWLPLAADPDYHKPYDVNKEYAWIAVWHNCGERIDYSNAAIERWPTGLVKYADGEKYAEWISRAKCSLNLSRSDELNMRVFEVMSIGTPLIADRARGIDRLFVESEHYLGFADQQEMLEKIMWVLDHPQEALAMANRARDLILDRHTYYHRILDMLGRY